MPTPETVYTARVVAFGDMGMEAAHASERDVQVTVELDAAGNTNNTLAESSSLEPE